MMGCVGVTEGSRLPQRTRYRDSFHYVEAPPASVTATCSYAERAMLCRMGQVNCASVVVDAKLSYIAAVAVGAVVTAVSVQRAC